MTFKNGFFMFKSSFKYYYEGDEISEKFEKDVECLFKKIYY